MIREEWLQELIDRLRPTFDRIGSTLPEKIRVSCGFPSKSALANKARRIGECWGVESSEDKSFQVFISPVLKDSIEVGGCLVHAAFDFPFQVHSVLTLFLVLCAVLSCLSQRESGVR